MLGRGSDRGNSAPGSKKMGVGAKMAAPVLILGAGPWDCKYLYFYEPDGNYITSCSYPAILIISPSSPMS
jgi:hypothetical protein